MSFKKMALICISMFFVLPVIVQAEEEPKKVEGIYRDNPTVYTKEGKKIGELLISNEDDIAGMSIGEITPRNLVGINFEDEKGKGKAILEIEGNETIKNEIPDDRILWFRGSHLRLSNPDSPVCPEVPTRSASMERPISSGIGCRSK